MKESETGTESLGERTYSLEEIKKLWDQWKTKRVMVCEQAGREIVIDPGPKGVHKLPQGITRPRWVKYNDTKQGKEFPDYIAKVVKQ